MSMNPLMTKVSIDCNIAIVGNTIEEAMERLKIELEGVTRAVTELGENGQASAIVADYHYWDRENEGDVDWFVYDHRAGKPKDWYASSVIHVKNGGDELMPRP